MKGEAETLAGLMLEIRGEFFREGESVDFDNIEFKAVRVENRRITRVEVTLHTGDTSDGDGSDD